MKAARAGLPLSDQETTAGLPGLLILQEAAVLPPAIHQALQAAVAEAAAVAAVVHLLARAGINDTMCKKFDFLK